MTFPTPQGVFIGDGETVAVYTEYRTGVFESDSTPKKSRVDSECTGTFFVSDSTRKDGRGRAIRLGKTVAVSDSTRKNARGRAIRLGERAIRLGCKKKILQKHKKVLANRKKTSDSIYIRSGERLPPKNSERYKNVKRRNKPTDFLGCAPLLERPGGKGKKAYPPHRSLQWCSLQ